MYEAGNYCNIYIRNIESDSLCTSLDWPYLENGDQFQGPHVKGLTDLYMSVVRITNSCQEENDDS
jgi:hypothetical protein